ncbi:MAG: DNA polymerase III subunit delta [Hyphomicrobiaceae bacterium]|nr:DNA polymerase III subunit delta [Hyphomicrobiaceae bacterium]
MVAVKAHQAQSFLKPPGPRQSAILFYGTDAGLVAERARALATLIAQREDPHGEIIRLDDADLDTDPERLAVELQTVPMFGGSKIVRATTGRRIGTTTIKPLLDEDKLASTLIVEAGNLRPNDSLRSLFEKSSNAAAVACYPDEAHDLESLISQTLKSYGLTIDPEARDLLLARVGADRALSRGEIEKLALYAKGKTQIDAGDIEAIVGDASELTIDKVVSAAASGDSARAVSEFARALTSGPDAQVIILALQRYIHRLHRIRCELDAGHSFEEVLRNFRPPIHFKQKDSIARQIRTWSSARLAEAVRRAGRAAKSARLSGTLQEAITEQLLLDLATAARAGQR